MTVTRRLIHPLLQTCLLPSEVGTDSATTRRRNWRRRDWLAEIGRNPTAAAAASRGGGSGGTVHIPATVHIATVMRPNSESVSAPGACAASSCAISNSEKLNALCSATCSLSVLSATLLRFHVYSSRSRRMGCRAACICSQCLSRCSGRGTMSSARGSSFGTTAELLVEYATPKGMPRAAAAAVIDAVAAVAAVAQHVVGAAPTTPTALCGRIALAMCEGATWLPVTSTR